MRIPKPPHHWNVTPTEAVAIQRKLAPRVRRGPPSRPIRLVAGVDLAYSKDGRDCLAAAVVWDIERAEVAEQRLARRRLAFPYVPGLLSFREAPAVLAALAALSTTPDALMADGHGIAHPRRFGLACHLGLLARLPAIGCAKSRLCGQHREPTTRRGATAPLVDRGERIGTVVRTRDGVRPVYVSLGHAIDLDTAVAVVLACGAGCRLPEPTRRADRLVAAARRGDLIREAGRPLESRRSRPRHVGAT